MSVGTSDVEPIVVDTMLASSILIGSRRQRSQELLHKYRQHLRGRALVLSFATVAELRYGAYKGGWGESRREGMETWFRSVAVVMPDDDLVRTCAEFRMACQREGHALCQKMHDSDRWIASTALRHNLPLVSGDRVFESAPGLVVLGA